MEALPIAVMYQVHILYCMYRNIMYQYVVYQCTKVLTGEDIYTARVTINSD